MFPPSSYLTNLSPRRGGAAGDDLSAATAPQQHPRFGEAAAGGGGGEGRGATSGAAGIPASALFPSVFAAATNGGAVTGGSSLPSSRVSPSWTNDDDFYRTNSTWQPFQVAAMTSCYRSTVDACAWAPLRICSLSLYAAALYQLVYYLSRGVAVPALLLAVLLVVASLCAISKLSTTKRSQYESIRRNSVRLPLLALALGCVAASRFVSPSPSSSFSVTVLFTTTAASLRTLWRVSTLAIRAAVAALLLGLAVLGRYIGPQSFMRCSTVPLAMNPAGEMLWTIWNNPMSLFTAGDGDGVLVMGGIFSSSYWRSMLPNKRRRYQHVPASTVMAQIVLAAIIGYAVTLVVAPFLQFHQTAAIVDERGSSSSIGADDGAAPDASDEERGASAATVVHDARVLLAGIATLTIHALARLLDWTGMSHELSPRLLLCWTTGEGGVVESTLDALPVLLRKAVGGAVLGTVLSTAVTAFTVKNVTTTVATESGGPWWWTLLLVWPGDFFKLTVYNTGIGLYALVLDEAVMITMFARCRAGAGAMTGDLDYGSSHGPLDELIEELCAPDHSNSRADHGLDVTVSSVASRKLEILVTSLVYFPSLVRAVLAPSPSGSATVGTTTTAYAVSSSEPGLIEREEDRRVVELAQQLGHLLVNPPQPERAPGGGAQLLEAPLEEDVLRASILKALADGIFTESWLVGSGSRLLYAIGESPLRGRYPMFVFTLVRALCVHMRGMGDALLTCASPANRGTPFLGASGLSLQRWHLPPGFVFAVECSIQALCTILAQHRTTSDRFVPWKSALLSIFVPITLSSMFHLRRGLLALEAPLPVHIAGPLSSHAVAAGDEARRDAIHHQRFVTSNLLEACDRGALSVVRLMELPEGHPDSSRSGPRDDECAMWVNGLLALQE